MKGHEIVEFLSNADNSSANLFEVFKFISNNFLSWKNIVNRGCQIPTFKNIVETINRSLKKQILIECDENYKYKRKGKSGEKGDLNPEKMV